MSPFTCIKIRLIRRLVRNEVSSIRGSSSPKSLMLTFPVHTSDFPYRFPVSASFSNLFRKLLETEVGDDDDGGGGALTSRDMDDGNDSVVSRIEKLIESWDDSN